MQSVETEYRNTDDWSKSQCGTIAQAWDLSLFWTQESKCKCLLNLEVQADIEAQLFTSSINAQEKASHLYT